MAAEDFWPEFGQASLPEVTCAGQGSLANRVLEVYDIPYTGSIGGELPDLDIKHMDAIQVIKLSLLEESANTGEIYEPIMGPDGNVEFKAIGTGAGVSDIYYEIQTSTYREDCSGVMVVGQDPMAYRKETDWYPIWGENRPEPMDAGFLYSSCAKPGFNQYCVLVYNDPHLDSSYKDGIANLYEINESNPWDTITGYATYMEWDGWESDEDTVITRSDSARVLIELPENKLGELRDRPSALQAWGEDPACFDSSDPIDYEGGLEVPIPPEWRFASVRNTTVDKFAGIIGVYVIGWEIDTLTFKPLDNAAAINTDPAEGSFKVIVSIDQTSTEVYKLVEGTHYVIAYKDKDPAIPYVVFANNVRLGEPRGCIKGNEMTSYEIDPYCEYAALGDASLQGSGYILPTAPKKGIKVEQIFVGVELETPSILVFNPDGNTGRAREVAESLIYDLMPLVTVDEPAPIAFNGTLLDQVDAIIDHDPTTAQNLEDTEVEKALARMDAGGGMSLTMSCLNEDQVETLSGALYDYMNSGTGVEATYVCGPNCDAELGATGPNGGIINAITYSYQDSSSYTISVNCGPTLVGGMSQVQGGPSFKVVESYSAKGTIVQDMGNHVYFKVRVDGYGEVIGVNMCPTVLRVGDKVSVTIHNNPVEA